MKNLNDHPVSYFALMINQTRLNNDGYTKKLNKSKILKLNFHIILFAEEWNQAQTGERTKDKMKSMVPSSQRRAVKAKDDATGPTMPARMSHRDSFDFDICKFIKVTFLLCINFRDGIMR